MRYAFLIAIAFTLALDFRVPAAADEGSDRLSALELRVDACLLRVQQAEARMATRFEEFEKRLDQVYAGRNPARVLDLVTPVRTPTDVELAVLKEVGLALESVWSSRAVNNPFGSFTSQQRQTWVTLKEELAKGTFGVKWPTAEQDIAGFAAGLRADLEAAIGAWDSDGWLSLGERRVVRDAKKEGGDWTKAVLGFYVARKDGNAARTAIGSLLTGGVLDAKSSIVEWRRQTNR